MDLLTPGPGMLVASILLSLIPIILIGILVGSLLYKRKLKKNKEATEEKAKLIIKEAELQGETIKKDRILDAKEKFLKMKQEFEEETNRNR